MRAILFVILSATILCGCVYTPPSTDTAKWYAVVAYGGPEKNLLGSRGPGTVCVMIKAKYWEPLFTPDGLGGSRENLQYWVNLEGDGPVYRDVPVREGNGHLPLPHLGTITIDKKNKRVIIDLQRIISKPGEPLKTEPSPANGTYRIKRWEE